MTVKISAMTAATTPLGGTEEVEIVQGGNTRKADVSDIALLSKTLAQLNAQVSDATIARTDATQTFTGAQQTGVNTLTDAATIVVDASASNAFKVTLTAARVLGNPTNVVEGMSWTVRVIQDGTGLHALTFGANYEWADAGAPDTSADVAAAERILTFYAVSATRIIAVDAVGAF